MADYSLDKLDQKSFINQLIGSGAQVDTSKGVFSITAQDLEQMEGLMKQQGLSTGLGPNATDAQRLDAVMSTLSQSGAQVSQTTQPDGSKLYSIELTPTRAAGAPGMVATDRLQTASQTGEVPQDSRVSAALSESVAPPSGQFANPYLDPGSTAMLIRAMFELFARKMQTQQSLAETGIAQVQMLIDNNQARKEAIGKKFGAENMKLMADLNAGIMTVTAAGMTATTASIAAYRSGSSSPKIKAEPTVTAPAAPPANPTPAKPPLAQGQSRVELSPEPQSSNSSAAKGATSGAGGSPSLLHQNLDAANRASTGMIDIVKAQGHIQGNNELSKWEQALADIETQDELTKRNLKAIEQQKESLNADGGKLLDTAVGLSQARVQMQEKTFPA